MLHSGGFRVRRKAESASAKQPIDWVLRKRVGKTISFEISFEGGADIGEQDRARPREAFTTRRLHR
jgi:hypothetical protein